MMTVKTIFGVLLGGVAFFGLATSNAQADLLVGTDGVEVTMGFTLTVTAPGNSMLTFNGVTPNGRMTLVGPAGGPTQPADSPVNHGAFAFQTTIPVSDFVPFGVTVTNTAAKVINPGPTQVSLDVRLTDGVTVPGFLNLNASLLTAIGTNLVTTDPLAGALDFSDFLLPGGIETITLTAAGQSFSSIFNNGGTITGTAAISGFSRTAVDIPAPSTLLLAGLGVAGLLFVCRLFRK
jgi:hypothetical protein